MGSGLGFAALVTFLYASTKEQDWERLGTPFEDFVLMVVICGLNLGAWLISLLTVHTCP